MKALKKKVETAILEGLAKDGFKKKGEGTCIRILDENIVQMIGFQFKSHIRGTTTLRMTTGLLYKDIGEIEFQIRGYSRWKYCQPMIGFDVIHVMPDNMRSSWDFSIDDTDIIFEEKIKTVLAAISSYIFPYLERNSTYENLIYELDTNFFWGVGSNLIPMYYYMKGNKEEAFRYIEKAISRMESKIPEEELGEYNKTYRTNLGNDICPLLNCRNLHCYLIFVEQFKAFLKSKQ